MCHIAERLGLALHGLAIDEEGLRPDALEEAAASGRARLLFVNPTAHNPTTATMSQGRREAIVALARRHDLTVIEDDVYGQLPAERPPPLAALAPERVIHISSASKSVAPGLRLGILASPAPLYQRLAEAQHDLFLTCPPLLAELFRHWLASGMADRLARQQRLEAAARQALARDLLGGASLSGPADQLSSSGCRCRRPGGPRSSRPCCASAASRSIPARPSRSIPPTRPHAVRVSLSAATSRERLTRALAVLARTLEEAPARRREVI